MLKKGLILQIISERHNAFAEEISKINLSSNDDKRLQSIDSVEMYAYGTSKNLLCKTERLYIEI